MVLCQWRPPCLAIESTNSVVTANDSNPHASSGELGLGFHLSVLGFLICKTGIVKPDVKTNLRNVHKEYGIMVDV